MEHKWVDDSLAQVSQAICLQMPCILMDFKIFIFLYIGQVGSRHEYQEAETCHRGELTLEGEKSPAFPVLTDI
jgi:hypothetical protein